MTRKSKKAIKRITENRKVRRAFLGILAFLALVCLGAAFGEKLFRSSVGIGGFEANYSTVSSKTRKALRKELEVFTILNTGDTARKSVKFAIREGQALAVDEYEDGTMHSSFYIDSEELQISAFVQMSWSRSFSNPDTSFIVRIDCATGENIKYQDSHCYSRTTGEAARAVGAENITLLESYGVSSDAIEKMQTSMLDYLKMAYPKTSTMLLERNSIKTNNKTVSANLKLDNNRTFALIVGIEDNWAIELRSGENTIWGSEASQSITANRNELVLKKLLPAELETKSGAHFLLSYDNKTQLVINSVKCAEGTKNSELEQTAKTWLKKNNFNADAFEIKLNKTCEN